MFIEPGPAPIRGRQRSSGFFSSQRPIESPRDYRDTTRRKSQPLAERSQSQNNQQNPWNDPNNPTVRLVKHSPPQPVENSNGTEDEISAAKENREGQKVLLLPAVVKPASASKPDLPGFGGPDLAIHVSAYAASTNEAHADKQLDTASLLYTAETHAHSTAHAVPKTEWHRRSGSTGNYSTSSTLKGGEESILGQRSERSEIRLSQGTTLRGTPTPTEQELRQRIEADETVGRASVYTLDPLPEASPERSTLRTVAASSEDSGSIDDPSSEPSTSPIVQVYPSPCASSDSGPSIPQRRSSWQALSTGSPQVTPNSRTTVDQYVARNQQSQESIAQSDFTFQARSSPNYIAYSPESRPRSGTYPLHSNYSIESIQSRLQYPDTGRSLEASSSWASLRPSSSTDTLPPLQVPKKRLRHKAASSSLNAAANASFTSGHSMADDDYDTEPYPREPFSSHLSTIASESDRTTSQQLSHFSLGSGVLTGDDSSSIPLSGTWPRRRRESAPISSMASDVPPDTSSGEEPGDMTLGVFREESAKPQPLFLPRSGSVPGDKRYDGPLPPLPPIPRSRDSDENIDRVTELQAPQLREKRSGYSLRQRSNSTPSRSHSHSRHLSQISRSESERWSQASSLFPTWAKNFYGHGAALLSSSKVSLGAPATPQRDKGKAHARNDSQWTERSITSRLGTGYSEIENASPTSSHFLPSIFRPRTRGRTNASGKLRKSRRSRPSGDDGRPDSMEIFNNPLPPGAQAGEQLPSGHPKYGTLKDGTSGPRRALPRKYSKQKHWDEMEFPRPMTKDRLSDFGMHVEDPHLAPTKRASNRFSMWRPPSFVESLDTLVRSRGNRQILLFALGFVCPLLWMLGAILPIPKRPVAQDETPKSIGGSDDDIQAAMMKHEAGDAEKRWREEKAWQKARWWRWLNRVMSVVGVLIIGAVVSSHISMHQRYRRR